MIEFFNFDDSLGLLSLKPSSFMTNPRERCRPDGHSVDGSTGRPTGRQLCVTEMGWPVSKNIIRN